MPEGPGSEMGGSQIDLEQLGAIAKLSRVCQVTLDFMMKKERTLCHNLIRVNNK